MYFPRCPFLQKNLLFEIRLRTIIFEYRLGRSHRPLNLDFNTVAPEGIQNVSLLS